MSDDPRTAEGPDVHPGKPFWERACFAFVLLVWLECLVSMHAYIAWGAARVPVEDDGALLFNRAIGVTGWEYIWAQHNEHRIPLPKLLQLLLYDWTGDIRSGMFAQAQIYAAVALACVLSARRLRGGSRPWDVFFPLMWMQLGNDVNLLMGFQVGIAIPSACVCTVLFCGVLSELRLWPSRAVGAGLALIALPLSGGAGMLQMPLLAAYSAWLGFTQRKHPLARERLGARLHMGFAAVALALGALYMVGYRSPSGSAFFAGKHPPWKLALANLFAPFGPDWFDWRPVLMPAVALGALLLARGFARHGLRARDPRTLGTLAVLGAGVVLVVVIGAARSGENGVLVSVRYVPLPAPFFVALTLGGLVLLPRRWREVALVCACTLMLFALPRSIRQGLHYGEMRRQAQQQLDLRVEQRASWREVEEEFMKNFGTHDEEIGIRLLTLYAKEHLPPFDRSTDYSDTEMLDGPYAVFDTAPAKVRFREEPIFRRIDGQRVCYVAPPTAFHFAVAPENHAFSCIVGVSELLLRSGGHPGVRAQVLLQPKGETPRVLGEIRLDPVRVPADQGLRRFEFSWPPGTSGELQLVFDRIPRPAVPAVPDRVIVRRARIE